MFKPFVFVSCLTLIAGCANFGGLPITSAPVDVAFQPNVKVPQADRLDLVTIRSFASGEVEGAKCVVNGTGYSANFATPAVLRLPVFRGRTDDVFVRCTFGSKSGNATLEAKNLSAPDAEGISISVGTGGARLGAVFSIRDRTQDRFNYDSFLRINLR